jgi:serine/threonine protein kinase
MGVVYKARDTRLDRDVAVKVLPHGKIADADRKQRFVQEAKAASALNHPNIITIHDIRADDGIDFIVMEFVDGRTLDQIIPAKGLEIAQSLHYAVQIADALARAHEAGIIHRDLKPSNVILTNDGRVKVLDFGLAKLIDPVDSSAESVTRTAPLTEVGIAMGTAAYMSPEQAQGRKVDARSDIFSFGAVLYEMVTGRRPFAGDSQVSILAKIISQDPEPPSHLAPSIAPDLERAILRCLRKDPARRFQSMADLKVALEDVAIDSGKASEASPRSASRHYGIVAAALLVGVVLAGAYFVLRERAQPISVQPSRAVPFTTLPGVVRFPSFSPDGDRVAFTWTGPQQDNPDVYVQQIGVGTPLRLTTNAANDYSPLWSPDGKWIAFLREDPSDARRSELRLIPPLGGPERKVIDIQPRGFLRAVTLSWCPDSRCIVLTDSATPNGGGPDALFAVFIESGEKKQITTGGMTLYADTDPALSPDGRWLVFRRDVSPFSGRLQLLQLDRDLRGQGEPRSLTKILFGAYGPRWISKNEVVFSARGGLWTMNPLDGTAPERLPFVGEDGVAPAVSAIGGDKSRLIYVRSFADSNIWRIETTAPGAPATSPPVRTISSTRREECPQFSPDGRRVAFMSGRSGEWEVWTADRSGADAVQLTSLGANPGYPRWSPDGKTVTFHSNSEEHSSGDVWVVSSEIGKPTNLTASDESDGFPTFSHDGQSIYFSSARKGRPTVWKMPASGGEPVEVSTKLGFVPIESDDGASLFFVETVADGPGPLWQLPLKGGEPVKLLDSVFSWGYDVTRDGIYYVTRVAGDSKLSYFDFATRQSKVVAEHLGTLAAGLSASRDGRTILFARVDSTVNDLMLVDEFRRTR